MSSSTSGWLIGIAAFGMMAGLLAVDVSQFMTWGEAVRPAFIGSAMGHLAVVAAAFVGGKLIPTTREIWTPEQRAAGGTTTASSGTAVTVPPPVTTTGGPQ